MLDGSPDSTSGGMYAGVPNTGFVLAGLHQLAHRAAGQILHRDELAPFVLSDLVDGDDVGVAKRGDRARLRAKPLALGPPIGVLAVEQLDRDIPIELGVTRQEHLPHAALAERAYDAIAPDRVHPRTV